MTLDELVQPLTPAQVEASILSAMAGKGLPTSSWVPGAVVRTIVTAVAIVIAAVTALIALIARSGFLGLARGPWLDLVASHVYGVDRIQESFATGVVRVTNVTGVGAFSIALGDLVAKVGSPAFSNHRAFGRTYRSTAAFTLPAVPGAFVDVPVRADEAGADSSAAPDTITTFVTTMVGCSVTNAVALVGSDGELDPALKARARAKTGVLSPNGPRDAYAYIATTARRADGTAIGVTRVRSRPDGVGGIDIYVADPDGTVTGTVGDLGTDLGVIDRDIQEQAVPLCVTARVASATAEAIAVSYAVWVDTTAGLSDEQLEALVSQALADYLAMVPIGGELIPSIAGGYVYRSVLAAAISRAVGTEHLIRLDLLSPASDVPVSPTGAPVLGTLTAVVHQVSSLGVI